MNTQDKQLMEDCTREVREKCGLAGYEAALSMVPSVTAADGWDRQSEKCKEDWRCVADAVLKAYGVRK